MPLNSSTSDVLSVKRSVLYLFIVFETGKTYWTNLVVAFLFPEDTACVVF